MPIKLKRAYAPPERSDGVRILVERLWPRGLTKDAAAIDEWAKALAPSSELRKWYAHDPKKWAEFQDRYKRELQLNADAVAALRATCVRRPVTFVFAAKDEQHNSAVVLKAYVESLAATP